MRLGSGETFGGTNRSGHGCGVTRAGKSVDTNKRVMGWTAKKQAYGEHYTPEVVPFAEVVLVRVPKPTHRCLRGGKRWHKGDAVFIKGAWVGGSARWRCRVFSRTIRRLEPSRRHDATLLGMVKGSTMGRTGWYCTRSTEKGTCTTTTVLAGEKHSEPQSRLAR